MARCPTATLWTSSPSEDLNGFAELPCWGRTPRGSSAGCPGGGRGFHADRRGGCTPRRRVRRGGGGHRCRRHQAIAESDHQAVVSDLDLGPGPTGANLLRRVADERPWVGLVALTAHRSIQLAVEGPARLPEGTIMIVKSRLDSMDDISDAVEDSLALVGAARRIVGVFHGLGHAPRNVTISTSDGHLMSIHS